VDPSWSVPAGNPWDYDFYLRLLGTEGSLDVTDTPAALHLVSNGAEAASGLRLVSFAEDPDRAMLGAFLDSVRAGTVLDPCATGADGLKALQVALSAYESAASGRAVSLTRTRPPR
jgi:predicted dehydrogenase